MGEIDVAFEASGSDEEDDLPALNETSTPVTKPGKLWLPGQSKYDLRRPRPRQGCNSSNDGERTLRAGRNHDARRHYRMATGAVMSTFQEIGSSMSAELVYRLANAFFGLDRAELDIIASVPQLPSYENLLKERCAKGDENGSLR